MNSEMINDNSLIKNTNLPSTNMMTSNPQSIIFLENETKRSITLTNKTKAKILLTVEIKEDYNDLFSISNNNKQEKKFYNYYQLKFKFT